MNAKKLLCKRIMKDYSLKEMGDIVGVHKEVYRLKEKGQREFKCSEIESVIRALQLTPEEVVEIFFS